MDKNKTKSTATTTLTQHTSIRSVRSQYARMLQNFLIIWLDQNIDEANDDCQNTITKLQEMVNTVNTFTDIDECIDFITDIKEEKVFMISSDTFGRTAVLTLHDVPQISSIYIFCEQKDRREQWTQQWPKVKGVFTDIDPICEALKKAAHKCDQNTISMSFVVTNHDITNQNLDQLDQSFMYTQILKEILLTINFKQEHFIEFITYYREQFVGNQIELKNVDKLEQQYRHHTPIWWYTYQCFLYSTLNKALRTMEIDLIIKLGFFVTDLHQHIVQLHSEQYTGHEHPDLFIVYRGQGFSQTDFDKLMKTKGGLMSFNNFLSTSLNRTVSLLFAQSHLDDPNLIGILFQITIHSSISSTPFANVREVGHFHEEEEILFSMHSIFRIGHIKQIDGNNGLWEVDLTLTSDHDPQLHTLTEYIREETFPHATGWYRLGTLLNALGQFDKAQQVCEVMLTQASEDRDRANVYYMYGQIKSQQKEYAKAITFYEKTIKICQKILSPIHPDLATSYISIGSVYKEMDEDSRALSYYGKALEIYQKTLPPIHPSLATCYIKHGSVYFKMGEHSKALSYYVKAHEIFQKSLPPNHPDLATSYAWVGSLYSKMGEHSKALSCYEKDLEISQKSLPPDHLNLATSYGSIGAGLVQMGEYLKARLFIEKELEIKQKNLPENHPSFASAYNNIAKVYYEMGDYSRAFPFIERAVDIGQRSLPENHPDRQQYTLGLEMVKKKIVNVFY